MDVAATLREARGRAGLTQAELADRSGTSQAAISAYESSVKQPSVDTLTRLLEATGSRLVAEPRAQRVKRPSRADHARVARGLLDVLTLADALPSRHEPEVAFPRLSRPAAGAR